MVWMFLTKLCILWLYTVHVGELTATSTEQSVVYVAPSDNPKTTECPEEHCPTLNDLIKESQHDHHYFRSNTTIILLAGNHTVSRKATYTIQDIENLSVIGRSTLESTASVICIKPFGMTFINTTNLSISDITFINCGAPTLIPVYEYTLNDLNFDYNFENVTTLDLDHTLCISHSHNVTIQGVAITNGTGVGLLLYNVYDALKISNSEFSNNEINCYILIDSNECKSLHISTTTFMYGNYGHIWFDQKTSGLWITLVNHTEKFTIDLNDVTVIDNPAGKGDIYMSLGVAKAQIQVKGLQSILTQNGTHGVYVVAAREHTQLSIIDSSFIGSSLMVLMLRKALIKNTTFDSSRESVYFTNTDDIVIEDVSVVNSVALSTVEIYFGGDGSKLTFRGHSSVTNSIGGFDVVQQSQILFEENSTLEFRDNNVNNSYCIESFDFCEPAMSINEVNVTMLENSRMYFVNNTAQTSGGLLLVDVHITFEGNVSIVFEENTGGDGGALELGLKVRLLVTKGYPFISFVRNTGLRGGAIYTSYHNTVCRGDNPIQWYFVNNTALVGGSIVYGSVASILSHQDDLLKGCDPDHMYIETMPNDVSVVASDPTRVCICEDAMPQCNVTHYRAEIFPNEKFQIDVAAVGLQAGAVAFVVQAQFDKNGFSWKDKGGEQYLQLVHNRCTTLTYDTYLSSIQMQTLKLTVSYADLNKDYDTNLKHLVRKHKNDTVLFQDLVISFQIKQCSLGYTFNQTAYRCDCQPKLIQSDITCDTTGFIEIYRPYPKWVNATFVHTVTKEPGVIVHQHCPFDYCKPDSLLPLDLEYPDDQCDFNRSGILCGTCRGSFSQVLGSTKCKKCSNFWMLLVIPVTIIAGIALVCFLMVFNLTVASGTINGLIFYANILRANQAIFFTPRITNSFLSWFIAWLNLDLGVETCFYDGLDGYGKTWLQFAFPLYIWFIVIAIILLSRRYATVSKLTGSNAVQVLATLFLLSYSKLLRTVITIFQSTTLVYPDGYIRRIWLYDGNVDYLRGKHIPLFIVALLLCVICLCIPYTTILVTIQWLQRHTQYRILSWVYKFKPVFDAYTGPYKDKHRYWTGLLLVVRAFFFLVFSLNVFGDPSINLLAIVLTVLCLLAYLSLIGGVYKQKLVNFIEITCLLNIGILSGATLFKINIPRNKDPIIITYLSTGIAFVMFLAICVYHAYQRIASSRRGVELKEKIMIIRQNYRNRANSEYEPIVSTDQESSTHHHQQLLEVSETVIDVSNLSPLISRPEDKTKSE